MAAYDDVAKLYYGANPDKRDPKVDVQAAVVAKRTALRTSTNMTTWR